MQLFDTSGVDVTFTVDTSAVVIEMDIEPPIINFEILGRFAAENDALLCEVVEVRTGRRVAEQHAGDPCEVLVPQQLERGMVPGNRGRDEYR